MVNAIKQPTAPGTIYNHTTADNDDVEKHRRLGGVLDGGSEATGARRVKGRAAALNQYRYDALGRRVVRKEGSTETALIWWGDSENAERCDRMGSIIDVVSAANGARRIRYAMPRMSYQYEHATGQACVQNDIFAHPSTLNTVIARAIDGDENDLEWYHKNYLDHVYAVSDDTGGDLIEHYRYSAFGEIEVFDELGTRIASTGIDNTITWNTRRLDGLTGFYLYKYRHYSPQLGRWPSRDPLQENFSTGEFNEYGFILNNAYDGFDILGLIKGRIIEYTRPVRGNWFVSKLPHTYVIVQFEDGDTYKFESGGEDAKDEQGKDARFKKVEKANPHHPDKNKEEKESEREFYDPREKDEIIQGLEENAEEFEYDYLSNDCGEYVDVVHAALPFVDEDHFKRLMEFLLKHKGETCVYKEKYDGYYFESPGGKIEVKKRNNDKANLYCLRGCSYGFLIIYFYIKIKCT